MKYFVASDTSAILDQAKIIYEDQLISTEGEPMHPSVAQRHHQLKILTDWYLLGLSDQLISVGGILLFTVVHVNRVFIGKTSELHLSIADSQSTFSATAWVYSLRPESFHHISDWGLCRL